MTTIEIYTTVISSLALLVSVITFFKQIDILKKTNNLTAGIELMKEYRSQDFKRKVKTIFEQIELKNGITEEEDFYCFDEDTAFTMLQISHFFDNVGLLIYKKAIDKDLVISYMGENAEKVWRKLYPLIKNVRKKKEGYQSYFEHLVFETRELNPIEYVRKNLKHLDEDYLEEIIKENNAKLSKRLD
ncbi:MAG: hypothetical protein HOP30_14650 [Cyclobacteriaceae bacterium]|nr:hypothetical protein [Cyclobacteriaceae bacterium]